MIRDAARGVFDLLPHTPVDGIGINADAHYRLESEEEWHAVGDLFAPKDFWQPLFSGDEWRHREGSEMTVGLRTLRVEAWRPNRKDYVRLEVAPSIRTIPYGVYVGINAHFQLTDGEERGTGYLAARTIDENWDEIRAFEGDLQVKLLEAAG